MMITTQRIMFDIIASYIDFHIFLCVIWGPLYAMRIKGPYIMGLFFGPIHFFLAKVWIFKEVVSLRMNL